jgi:hypothetical protein
MDRRGFLKLATGSTAALVVGSVFPGENTIRRLWPGFSAARDGARAVGITVDQDIFRPMAGTWMDYGNQGGPSYSLQCVPSLDVLTTRLHIPEHLKHRPMLWREGQRLIDRPGVELKPAFAFTDSLVRTSPPMPMPDWHVVRLDNGDTLTFLSQGDHYLLV